jgi:hypothetical protein
MDNCNASVCFVVIEQHLHKTSMIAALKLWTYIWHLTYYGTVDREY